jgi:hypothetical protein
MNNTSISKAVCLNFSDGTNTVYTKSAQINIPFEVEYIRVANINLSIDGGAGAEMNAIITSNLVDNDVIATGRQYTSTKPLKHYYQIPRPINGSYDFSINLSNTLANLTQNVRIGYEAVGTILVGTYTITFTAGDDVFFSFVEDDFETPPGRLIRTGAGPYILGTNSFNVVSYDSGTNVMTTSQVAAGTLNNANWFMDGNLLTVNEATPLVIVGSFSEEYDPRITITKQISAGRYRLNLLKTYEALHDVVFNTPQLYRFYNLNQCEVVLDLEFYKKVSVPRIIQNTQYYLWNSNTFNDIFNIDVLFPVDEIRVVNFNMISTNNITTIVGFSSDLVQSSILTNENYLTFNSIGSGNYQVNKKKYEYPIPRIINGAYKINANYMFTGLPYDLATNPSTFYFHFLFISYRKE